MKESVTNKIIRDGHDADSSECQTEKHLERIHGER